MERLEDRLAPATVNYYGVSDNWNDTNNWTDSVLPTPLDDVVIDAQWQPAVVNLNLNSSAQVATLQIASGFTLNVNGQLSAGAVQLEGGTLTGTGAVSVNHFTITAGTLAGSASVSINSSLNWRGGTMAGSGTTTIQSGATGTIMPLTPPSPPSLADTRTLVNQGDITWTNPTAIAPTTLIDNRNSLKFINGNLTYDAATPIRNSGTLSFDTCNITFNGPLTIDQTVRFIGAYDTTYNTITLNGDTTFGNLYLSSSVNGTGNVTVTNYFSWEHGWLSGTGNILVAPTATFHLPFGAGRGITAGRRLTVQGTHTWAERTPNDGIDESFLDLRIAARTEGSEFPNDGVFDNRGVPRNSIGAVPSGPLTGEQADALAGEIYQAMYGGLFGAGVDKEAIYRALANRSREDVDDIASAYSVRYSTPERSRVMENDLNSQWEISQSPIASARIRELLAGNQPGADAVEIRGLVTLSSTNTRVTSIRDILYRGNLSAVSTEYARLYPTDRVQFTSGVRPSEALPPLQYDVQYAFNNEEAILLGNPEEIVDFRTSVNLLFEGNRVASDAVALHGLRAAVLSAPSEVTKQRLTRLLETKSAGELAAINAEYQQRYSVSILDSLSSTHFVQQRDLLEALLNGGRFDVLAVRLRHAFDQDQDGSTSDLDGTDEDAVWRILDGLYADERVMVSHVYRQRYNDRRLAQEIEDEFSNTIFSGLEREKTFRLFYSGGLTLAERVYYAVFRWGTDEDEILRAMRELRQMTPAQIQQANDEYARLVPGGSLLSAFEGDLNGSLWNDARLSLGGRLTTVQQYYDLARQRWEYDRGPGVSNWLGNFLSGINTQGENLDRTWQAIQAAYNAIPEANRNDPIENHPAFRRVVQRIDQDLQFYRGFRSAAADVVANAAATAAGILVVLGSGGTATPLVIVLAAGVGSTTQALTRMGIMGTFTWEELPADVVMGGLSGATVAFSFPVAARQAIIDGTARAGVLRQVAGSTFGGGAISSGVGAALNENTWAEGFGVGLAHVTEQTLVGGLAGTVLGTVPGAALTFGRSIGLTALTRRIVTTTGSQAVQLFSANFHRLVRQAMTAGRTFAEAMSDHLANFTQRLDDISLRLFNTTPGETAAAIRQAIRNLLSNDQWPPFGFEGVADVGTELWIASRSEFATLGQQGIRERLLNGLQILYNSISENVDNLLGRLTGAGATAATRDVAEELAERLAALENFDEATIRQAVQAILPEQAGNQQLIRSIRNLLVIQSLPGANPAIRTLGEELANRAKDLYRILDGTEKRKTTIAVSRIRVNDRWVEVVTVNAGAPPSVMDKIRPLVEGQGGILRQATGRGARGHAEIFLYDQFHASDGFELIGVSHKDGPCPKCLPLLDQLEFRNVYWDETFVPWDAAP